jgi:eukaryotic-like serine/threonine-protein kinase
VADTATGVRPGDVLSGRYRVERTLGSGGMGVVVEATQLLLDRRVAVKVLSEDVYQDPEARERLMREARAAAQIRGEHVARVLDVGEHEGVPYVVMELLEGVDLGARLATEGPLPVQEAVDALLEACAGLAEAHAAGIVHRDVKPSNLFQARKPDGSTTIKVLDFGISKRDEPGGSALTQSNTGIGTPLYMAPEQVRDGRSATIRTDIWALGVVLYEIVTGARPFDGMSLTAVSARILESEPEPMDAVRPEVPGGLASVAARCLRKDPAERYPDVAVLATALVPFGSEAGRRAARSTSRLLSSADGRERKEASELEATEPSFDAPAPGVAATASAWTTNVARGRRRAAGVIAVAVAAVALGGWLWVRSRDARSVEPAAVVPVPSTEPSPTETSDGIEAVDTPRPLPPPPPAAAPSASLTASAGLRPRVPPPARSGNPLDVKIK